MKTALWILLAGFLTCVTAAGLLNTVRSDDRETLVGNVLLSLSVGWYMVTNWRRAYRSAHRRPHPGVMTETPETGNHGP
ncbi:hypothetical protein OG410_06695 [Streptomyces sp. NBC_00659]|uniref:hypothetical protein n=1 Tax=Streptomyces sp. NBC_00659 TaxID=2903669 RepID=UPI002E322BB2|nr:hypothetical protein [Streptomyces sp. NBC_00659]